MPGHAEHLQAMPSWLSHGDLKSPIRAAKLGVLMHLRVAHLGYNFGLFNEAKAVASPPAKVGGW